MKAFFIVAILGLAAFTEADKLTGTWQGTSSLMGTYRILFGADKTFELTVNDKPRVSGSYTLTDSIFTIEDYGCPGYTGKYALRFSENGDTCRFSLIEDNCEGRASNADNSLIYRVK